MHKGYSAYTDHGGKMQEIVIVGYDHKKYCHLQEPLADGTLSVPIDECYTYPKLKVLVRKELMKLVFSKATPKREKDETEDE